MNQKSYYDVLGLPPNCTQNEIKSAYKKLVKKYHPDNYRNHPLEDVAQEKMQEINEAYQVLSDPVRRQTYDRGQGTGQSPFGGYGQNPYQQSGWGQQGYPNSPYYQNRRSMGGCDPCLTLCVADSCCECMGGDLISCC